MRQKRLDLKGGVKVCQRAVEKLPPGLKVSPRTEGGQLFSMTGPLSSGYLLSCQRQLSLEVVFSFPGGGQHLFGGKQDTWEVFVGVYYYLPVAHKFAIVVEAQGNLSEDIELRGHWVWQYTVTFAYDLPLEDLKALVKWESGRNEFTLEKDTKLMLGLLVDYIPL